MAKVNKNDLKIGVIITECTKCDRVKVVRCKDCLWYKAEKGCPLRQSGYFKGGKMLPLENDFCSYGERMADNDVG